MQKHLKDFHQIIYINYIEDAMRRGTGAPLRTCTKCRSSPHKSSKHRGELRFRNLWSIEGPKVLYQANEGNGERSCLDDFWFTFDRTSTIFGTCWLSGPNLDEPRPPKAPRIPNFHSRCCGLFGASGTKLASRWHQKRKSPLTAKNQLNASGLAFSWFSGVETRSKNPE